MKKSTCILFLFSILLLSNICLGQKLNIDKKYSFQKGDDNGIGVRSAVGMMLPDGIPVEIEAMFELK